MPSCHRHDADETSARGRFMEMHEIRYFLAASQTLNFHRAADLVHVGQPALTRAIQKLEAELGGYLFHREKTRVRLTDFGCLMRTHLDEVLQRSETARSFLSLETASLTLGVMCTIGPAALHRFPQCLSRALSRHRSDRHRGRGKPSHRPFDRGQARRRAAGQARTIRPWPEGGSCLPGAFRPRFRDRPSFRDAQYASTYRRPRRSLS
ncbi:hypothetical protein MES5069_230081 [Mesorhizobium escarrei]|uniref:HTH lysR-type domain-containing protein n=1 Tax=Mesorhizobium escarrei TaxID=666018 RepID=A0ABM9DSJ2_9HYPH|nr:hypothetical protein MES5069_230081 [Mesorhizobium escarrei]